MWEVWEEWGVVSAMNRRPGHTSRREHLMIRGLVRRYFAGVYIEKSPPGVVRKGLRGGGYLLFHFRSIIGVARFNFSVRNGKRWSPCAIATLVFFICALADVEGGKRGLEASSCSPSRRLKVNRYFRSGCQVINGSFLPWTRSAIDRSRLGDLRPGKGLGD